MKLLLTIIIFIQNLYAAGKFASTGLFTTLPS
jgi:hypothetical protein